MIAFGAKRYQMKYGISSHSRELRSAEGARSRLKVAFTLATVDGLDLTLTGRSPCRPTTNLYVLDIYELNLLGGAVTPIQMSEYDRRAERRAEEKIARTVHDTDNSCRLSSGTLTAKGREGKKRPKC